MSDDITKIMYKVGTVAPGERWMKWFNEATDIDKLYRLHRSYSDRVPYVVFLEYVQAIEKWPNPRLPHRFKERFPKLSSKLNMIWKKRTVFQAMEYWGITWDEIGKSIEKILNWIDLSDEQKEASSVVCTMEESCKQTTLRLIDVRSSISRRFVDIVFPEGTMITFDQDGTISLLV